MDLYLDAEWFIGGEIFLIGWSRDTRQFGQLHDHSLVKENFLQLLDETTGIIYFYGPDIGIIEKHFEIDIRSHYHCVNLLKVFKDKLPGLKSYKLANIEKIYGLKRNRNEYKTNIFSIFQDWRKPQVKSLVLQYNREDVINLAKLKQIVFAQHDVEDDYLLQVRLAGAYEIYKDFVYLLPCDIYRGKTFGKYKDGSGSDPNITAQMVVAAKFNNDKVSLYSMIVLMADVAKKYQYDMVTCVNNRDSIFHMAKALAEGIASRLHTPFKDVIYKQNSACLPIVKNKRILLIDDVIYSGATMKNAIAATAAQGASKIHFLAFGKSSRFAY